jgi:hypothetical protein
MIEPSLGLGERHSIEDVLLNFVQTSSNTYHRFRGCQRLGYKSLHTYRRTDCRDIRGDEFLLVDVFVDSLTGRGKPQEAPVSAL